MVKGILVSRDCKMLDFRLFGGVKCELFYAREASISLKMLREMRIIDATLVNADSIVQIRVKMSSEAFRRSSGNPVTQTLL